jgi:hypothetical protein
MSYSEFTIDLVKKQFNLQFDETTNLFADTKKVDISDHLKLTLAENIPLALAIATEKARSELIIAPILVELRKLKDHKVSLFSGVDFNVDQTKGLNGVCDFIISKSAEQLTITAPVVMLVEAKNEDMKRGYGQCIAEMLAARQFNLKENIVQNIYGVVTTGNNWRFLQLAQNIVYIDSMEYYINQIDKIMGILLQLVS